MIIDEKTVRRIGIPIISICRFLTRLGVRVAYKTPFFSYISEYASCRTSIGGSHSNDVAIKHIGGICIGTGCPKIIAYYGVPDNTSIYSTSISNGAIVPYFGIFYIAFKCSSAL